MKTLSLDNGSKYEGFKLESIPSKISIFYPPLYSIKYSLTRDSVPIMTLDKAKYFERNYVIAGSIEPDPIKNSSLIKETDLLNNTWDCYIFASNCYNIKFSMVLKSVHFCSSSTFIAKKLYPWQQSIGNIKYNITLESKIKSKECDCGAKVVRTTHALWCSTKENKE